MNRQKKQLLLERLDRIVHLLLHEKVESYDQVRRNEVIRLLIAIQEGCCHDENDKAYASDNRYYNRSRLIRTWHRMSMDLSI